MLGNAMKSTDPTISLNWLAVDTQDNSSHSGTVYRKSLQRQWQPTKSLWKYRQKRSVNNFTPQNHTDKQTEYSMKPMHNKRILDLTNELDKNLGRKDHKKTNILGLNETDLHPWKDNENLSSKCNHDPYQRRNWTVISKLEPLSYRRRTDFDERFLNNKLSVSGSKWNLEKRGRNTIALEERRKVGMKIHEIKSVSGSSNHSQWSEDFTKARVKRLNEVLLSFSDVENSKFRSRRLKCSCLFHQ